MNEVSIIGAGLAGTEAAWQLAIRGIKVVLYEMKPEKKSPAHNGNGFAELVCSNSLRSNRIENAAGLLKEELRRLGSLIINSADATKVEAGGALAVDRGLFSELVTKRIIENENIRIVSKEICEIPSDRPLIIAAGPLASDKLGQAVADLVGDEGLHFYDAVAPIVDAESIDHNKCFIASRYGRGDGYINCPMTEEEYLRFYNELKDADQAEVRGFEDKKVFEGCMPIEVIARRGIDTMRFGPLKPVGLIDPKTGKEPYAVIQLRRENNEGTLYNIVGFQTHLKFGEQKRIFSMIPGLENCEIVRFGVMHRNTFINSPALLDRYYRLKKDEEIMFAGQITGVEGYVESASSGYYTGRCLAARLLGEDFSLTKRTATGALAEYVSSYSGNSFQPMNINFGIMEPYTKDEAKTDGIKFGIKADRYKMTAKRSLAEIEIITGKENLDEGNN